MASRFKLSTLDDLLGRGVTVDVTPSVVTSKSWNTIEFRITLGSGGLARGDRIGLVCGSNIDRWQFQFASHIWGCYTPWQVSDPAAPNFLTSVCSRKGAELDVRVGEFGGLKLYHNQASHLVKSLRDRSRYVLEIGADRPLRKGDVITITWGDTRWSSPGVMAPALALPYYFLPFKFSLLPRHDRDLPIRQGNYDALPCLRVKGNRATRLHCAVQPLVGKGEKFAVHCVAVDEFGNRDEDFTGEVRLTTDDKKARLPGRVVFRKTDGGKLRIEGVRFATTGWQSLAAVSDGLESPPHPILVSEKPPANRLFFGEMHGHTLDCDGTFPAKTHFEHARDTAGLDFASCGSHAEYFGTFAAWDRYLKAATAANERVRFVTFYGYEWAGEGHTNAYFIREKDAVNIYGKRILRGKHPADDPSFRIACNRERAFVRKVKALDCPTLCITHFHSRYVDPVDDEVIRLHEVYSMHQQNPLDGKLQDILARGLKIGVVAGSDSHRLPIGSLCPDPDSLWNQPLELDGKDCSQSIQKKAGVQATFAPALSRKDLWDSMQRRHTYGTTGARIVMLLEVDGTPMGEEMTMRKGQRPHIRARIGGTAEIDEVILFRYDGRKWTTPFERTRAGALALDFEHVDAPLSADTLFYVRVRQVDNERGWTSPVWIQCET